MEYLKISWQVCKQDLQVAKDITMSIFLLAILTEFTSIAFVKIQFLICLLHWPMT
jgi:hypothetical protein